MRTLMTMDAKLDMIGYYVVAICWRTMKKRKRKAEFNPELRAQGQENRRLLAERIAYHEKRRAERRRAHGEAQA